MHSNNYHESGVRTGRPGLRQRLAWDLAKARGIPVGYDLSPFEEAASMARRIDLASTSDGDLLSRARAVREGPGCPGPDGRPLCLALAAEAARRSLGIEAYDVQLVAAAALRAGLVVQMQTGEGKTLAIALASACFALDGKPVHVFTANDYLARRDAAWMGGLYGRLGLSASWIEESTARAERKTRWRSDILYVTSREAGFDYLRDGLAMDRDDTVGGPIGAAIFDEADFVLIDEARAPLVIAGVVEGEGRGLGAREADSLAAGLVPDVDYRVDPRGTKVALSLEGLARIATLLGKEDMADDVDLARVHAALYARAILRRDVDYVVRGEDLRPVDEFTGRRSEERRWPWGIQAALEAKEGLEPTREGSILGSITIEHLAARYPILAATTATALAAAEDFNLYYGLGTVVIPPRLPSRRVDAPDVVWPSRRASLSALVEEVAGQSAGKRPVLIGTQSIAESEEVAAALAARGIAAAVLNAKNDEAEAELVALAGMPGAVTVSTNMAGRGTDIRLGGPTAESASGAVDAGGLYIIGLGRRESRRVDEQLRGRAGRQGDPGLTRFFVSLEDGFFLRYGVRDFLPATWREEADPSGDKDKPIGDPRVLRELDRAQSIITNRNRELRRSLRKYSLILELDRRALRAYRDAALLEDSFPEEIEAALAEGGRGGAREAKREAVRLSFLLRLDRLWADHLALVEELKEGAGLLRYGGLDPGIEYAKRSGDAFEAALETAVRDTAAEALSGEAPGGDAGLHHRGGIAAEGSVWTYVSEEEPLPLFSILGARNDLGAAIGRAVALFLAAFAGRLSGRKAKKPGP